MAFKSYLVRPFDTSQENIFFRNCSNDLKNKYSSNEGMHILIGNLSCNGHQMDAIFIASSKIIVIDFKNYGGELTFSENNPWIISKDGDFVYVKGGGSIRNPFQQVNAYRHSLKDLLNINLEKFLDPNHLNFNPSHVSGMILFHQPITFDIKTIPAITKVYFEIADINSLNYLNFIEDRVSNQLFLNDGEIDRLVKSLDINDSNLFDDAIFDQIGMPQKNKIPDFRKKQIDDILNDFKPKNQIENILTYYTTLITLERKKEVKLYDLIQFNNQISIASDNIEVDLSTLNKDFFKKYQANKSQNFPKNLYIGLNIIINGQFLDLLCVIIPSKELKYDGLINFNIKDLIINPKPLEDRNYPDDLIEELSKEVEKQPLLVNKLDVVEKYLGGSVFNNDLITIALCEDAGHLAQLISELKKLQKNIIQPNTLIYDYLIGNSINTKIDQIDNNEFIKITDLNTSQVQSINVAFNQPISIITGPPGTGKTQVVLNIIANAIIQNKKVLFASKNNKAVDTVLDKFNEIIEDQDFLLRLGSKKAVEELKLNKLKPLIFKIDNNAINQNDDSSVELLKNFNEFQEQICNLSSISDELVYYKEQLNEIENQYNILQSNYTDWKLNINIELLNFIKSNSIENVNKIFEQFFQIKSEIANQKKGIKNIFLTLSKNKYYEQLIHQIHNYPQIIKDFIFNDDKSKIKSGKITSTNELDKLIGYIISKNDDIHSIYREYNNYEQSTVELKKEISGTTLKIKTLESQKLEKIIKISNFHDEINKKGKDLVKVKINDKILKCDTALANEFLDFIPDKIPFKDNELPDFIYASERFLEIFSAICVTNLSIKNSFPLVPELLDLLVIDEASQCDVASAIPLIYRSKQVVVIGDPLQLKHITKIQSEEESYILEKLNLKPSMNLNYIHDSLYDYCFKLTILSKFKGTMLNEHYRCHPQIISFSNNHFYKPLLGQELQVKTNDSDFNIPLKGIYWVNVNGKIIDNKNLNEIEVAVSIDLAKLLSNKYINKFIGITTPFRHQANELSDILSKTVQNSDHIKADVVHSFQGDEKDIMIFDTVVTFEIDNKKVKWINESVPHLINVAVTRAKSTLFIVGNHDFCISLNKKYPLYKLARYVKDENRLFSMHQIEKMI